MKTNKIVGTFILNIYYNKDQITVRVTPGLP